MSHLLLVNLAAGALLCVALMAAVWLLSLRLHNYSIVDVAWSASFTLLALLYAALGDGWGPRRIAVAVMVSLWSLRLTLHLWRRVAHMHPREDSRYEELRKRWNSGKFFLFFEAQGVLSVMLSLPFALACLDKRAFFHPLEIGGALLWLIAVSGEAIADAQLAAFKRDPQSAGRTMDRGLWRYSRHPNYFFEWLIWVAWFVIALSQPWGWTTIYCPLLMLHFLLNVTGVPMAEEQSLKSRGEEYRRYQERTSKFVPLPVRRPA